MTAVLRSTLETSEPAASAVGTIGPAGSGSTPRVLGLDLSLTSAGVAGNSGGGWTDAIRPKKLTGLDRMLHIRGVLFNQYLTGADLVVIEGPSYGSTGGSAHERAGLWWLVVDGLRARDIAYAVMPPTNRAQYATGMGDANKREVLAAVKGTFPQFDGTKRPGIEDEADALVLAAAGADWLGHPLVVLPERHRAALAKCVWPDLDLSAVAA